MSEWISVKERMPEPGKRVLATIAGASRILCKLHLGCK